VEDDSLFGFIRSFWLVWLVVLFAGIMIWTLWPGRKRKLEAHGRIPLEDDEPDRNPREAGHADKG